MGDPVQHGSTDSTKVVLELTGSEAEHGLPLGSFAAFVEDFRRALRDYDRQRRTTRTRRGGHPSGREELVTAFRLVGFEAGSAIVTLEPVPVPVEEGQEAIEGAELLAIENLRSLLDSIEGADSPLDAAVTEALGGARRALGDRGRIEVVLADAPSRKPRRVVIDEQKVADLERRVRRYAPRQTRISGRLHMIDVEPDRVAIRATDGVDWICTYPEEMEREVKALIDTRVVARGVGQLQSANRGSLRLEEVQPVGEFEQTELFTFERQPLEALMELQGISGPQGRPSITPDEISDDELDAFVAALDGVE